MKGGEAKEDRESDIPAGKGNPVGLKATIRKENDVTNTLSVLNTEGDLKVAWDTDNEQQIDVARAAFESAREQGYAAYRTDGNGGSGEQIREFDPEARTIVMRPQMVGG